ncbi:hypothetical protein V6N13_076259 [Hibiscus sabdariffa]|uniref:Gag-pol polyprotein n=1 Tax=Hibiscus sabdariffa TaxID=183260 RepID=A0ABR2CTT3_9ROSI
MAQSIDKPPYFNGEHYAYWKNRMMFFIKGPDEYAKVSSCESAKEVWHKLEVIHEGTNCWSKPKDQS